MPILTARLLTARLAARVHQWAASVAARVSKPHYQRVATVLLGLLLLLCQMVSPDGNAPGGNPGAHTTAMGYNAFGDTVAITAPLGQRTLFGYDPDRNRTSVTDPLGRTTAYTFDLENRQTGVLQPDGSATLSGYDPAGNVITRTDALGRATLDTYDGANRLTQRQDGALPAPGSCQGAASFSPLLTDLAYDANGNPVALTQHSDSLPATRGTMGYDAADRLVVSADGADGAGATTYGYDAAGRPRSESIPGLSGLQTFTPDANGWDLTSAETAGCAAIPATPAACPPGAQSSSAFTYYENGLPREARLGASGVREQRTYDGQDRPTNLTADLPGGQPADGRGVGFVEDDQHDPQGRTASLHLQSGATTGDLFFRSSWEKVTYTPLGQLFKTFVSPSYAGDPRSRRPTGGEWRYGADGNIASALQTTCGAQQAQGCALAGMDTQFAYRAPTVPLAPGLPTPALLPNELATARFAPLTIDGAAGPVAYVEGFAYDNAGNTTDVWGVTPRSGRTALPQDHTSIAYDAAGRPGTITLDANIPGGNPQANERVIALHYNVRGERDRYTVTAYGSAAVRVDQQIAYQDGRVARVHVSGSQVAQAYSETVLYRQDGTPLELLYQRDGSQDVARYWYVVDTRGSVVALADAAGHMVNRYSYDEWGRLDTLDEYASYEAVPQPLRYRGYWDDGWNAVGTPWYAVSPYGQPTGFGPRPFAAHGHGNARQAAAPASSPSALLALAAPRLPLATDAVSGTREAQAAATGAQAQRLAQAAGLAPGAVGAMDLTPGTPRGEGQLYWYWVGGRSYDPALARYLQPDPAAADGARDYTYAHDDPLDYCQGGTCGGPQWPVIPGVPYNPDQLRLSPSYLTLFLDAVQSAAGAFLLLDGGAGGAGLGDEALIGGERTPLNDRQAGGCSCFPAATGVDTPRGRRAIATLHVGDTVLAEDPRTGTVTPEPVTAVIDDGIKPLLAVALSDGEAITVTANHPFWVDGGAQLSGPGWLQAANLRVGDRLHTANGRDVAVTGLRLGVGQAMVYTLTVARDHTFFVGSARVLVHNSNGEPCPGYVYPTNTRAHPSVEQRFPHGVGVTDTGDIAVEPYAKYIVRIRMRGNYSFGPDGDYGDSNEAIGKPRNWQLDGYTWHHGTDRTTMYLVPSELHARIQHTGGVEAIRRLGALTDPVQLMLPVEYPEYVFPRIDSISSRQIMRLYRGSRGLIDWGSN